MSNRNKKGSKKSSKRKSDSLDKILLKYFITNPNKSFSQKQITKKFLKKHSKEDIVNSIESLLGKGDLKTVYGSKLRLRGKTRKKGVKKYGTIIEGVVDMTMSGAAFVISDELDQDVYVPAKLVKKAMNRDTVKVAVYKQTGKRKEGEIIEIVKRAQEVFIGTMHVQENFAFLVSDKGNRRNDIFIYPEGINGAKDGDKAMVRVTDWHGKGKNPVGKVIELLGHAGDHDIEMKSILLDNGFHLEFPEAALKEGNAISDKIPSSEIKDRLDYRSIPTFTIDPDDAKDFDDALSVQQLKNGDWEIGIHIADVTHYVKPDSPLDKEAYERATSVYLVDRVCPMLPEMLSNLICSLRPKEEKLCFSVICTFDPKHEIKNVTYAKTVILSNQRFTYNEAQEVMDRRKGPFAKELAKLTEIGRHFRKIRKEHGSINFETTEVKFKLDENAHPIGVYLKERKEVHMLIEDFMLLANELVAKFVSNKTSNKKPVPFVYRVHDRPDTQKLLIFANIAKRFGHKVSFKDPEQTADALNSLMDKIKGKKEENILNQMAIRTMAKAVYTHKNIGHYGLAMKYYTHFTSPIRRYPDMLVHRILSECLMGQQPSHTAALLEEKCKHASAMERSAMDAERASVKYKQVEYMSDRLGEEFDAIISGVIPRGIFVEMIDNKCEGFVRSQNLGDEPFIFEENDVALIGEHTYTKFRLGDKLKIVVVSTNIELKQIECELVPVTQPAS